MCEAVGVSIATFCDRCDRHSAHLGVAQICTVLFSFLPFLLSFSPVLACCLARAVLGSSSPSSLPLLSSPCVACCFARAHRVLSSLLLLSSLIILVPGLHMDSGCRSRKCSFFLGRWARMSTRVHHICRCGVVCVFCAVTYEGDPPTMQLSCRNVQEPRESSLLGCGSPCVFILLSTQQRRSAAAMVV